MKKTIITMLMSLAIAGSACVSVLAQDDIADVKKQIAALEGKLAKLEAGSAAAGAPASSLKFSGHLRGRFEMSEAEPNTFQSTEIGFNPRWDASERIHAQANLWFYPTNGFYLESAMMTVDELGIGKGSKMVFGKTRNLSYGIVPTGPNRLLSNYSLYSDSYHHDRVWGIQSLNKLDSGNIDLNISVINGYTIGFRGAGIALFSGNSANAITTGNQTTRVLANREEASGLDTNNNKAVSARISGKVTKNLELGLSGYTGRLSNDNAGTSAAAIAAGSGLMNLTGGFTATKRRHTMLGGEFRYKEGPWVWQAEFTTADIGGYKTKGGQTVLGYTIDDNDSVYVQYGQVDNKTAPVATHSATWDKQQIALSWKHNLAKAAWLQLEHEINQEDPPAGTAKVENDLTLLEYFVGF